MKRFFALATLVLAVSACDDRDPTTPGLNAPETGPVFSTSEDGIIPGHYIVTVSDAADPVAVAQDFGITPDHVYTHLLTGFAAPVADAVLEQLKADPRVQLVEADGYVEATGTQTPATWGLDRIDQRALPLDDTYTYQGTGEAATAYIVDTGIRYDHVEFEGRAKPGFDAFDDGQNGNDCQGHGTHVAGTVGSRTYGVAKKVQLVAVRVLNCSGSGSFSGVIAGMDWVGANGQLPAVANLSLGSIVPLRSASVDNAVRRLIESGVTVVLAAGNGFPNGGVAQDACTVSPAGTLEAITVGASDKTDTKTTWSNYGDCVDWFSPGRSITSAWHTSSTDTRTISGTSMAAPHTAGAAALVLGEAPGATPQQVRGILYDATTKGVVQLSLTTNNHLLYNGFKVPDELKGSQPKSSQPCTPKRQREGVC